MKILCFSPDQRLLAVALLDNTVKVFFVDTLKVRKELHCLFLYLVIVILLQEAKVFYSIVNGEKRT